MNGSTNLFPSSKQRFHKSQFLQKLSCQKPYWDQPRLSSLVNKQVATAPDLLDLLLLGPDLLLLTDPLFMLQVLGFLKLHRQEGDQSTAASGIPGS